MVLGKNYDEHMIYFGYSLCGEMFFWGFGK
jgi:hypothetical protein